MDEKNLISEHNLDLKKYSLAHRLRIVIVCWVIFVALLIAFKNESVQRAMVDFANSVTVNWVYKLVDFLTNGFIWVGIPIGIYTISAMIYKKKFDAVKIYSDGLEFINDSKSDFVPYESVSLENVRNKGFKISCSKLNIKDEQFLWTEFSDSANMKINLERYGTWG